MNWVVLSYDIVCDKRRARLHRRLAGILTPVQKSVFEGGLSDSALVRLTRVVTARINPDEDDVRIWLLCPGCRGRTVWMGRAKPVPDPRAPLVV